MRWFWLVQTISIGLVGLILLVIIPMIGLGRVLPAGDQIAFMYDPRGPEPDWNIYLMDMRYGIVAPLVMGEAQDRYPEWSPDGKRLAYHANPRGFSLSGPFDAYVLDVASGKSTLLPISSHPALEDDNHAMIGWSPDSGRIAFHAGLGMAQSRPYRIVISDPNGEYFYTIPSQDYPGEAIYASWSPDGRWLAFVLTNFQSAGISGLYVMEVGENLGDPLGEPILVFLGNNDILFPDWSPDGRQITFAYNQPISRPGNAPFSQSQTDEIYAINSDGTDLRQITQSPPGTRNMHPVWLPDGSGVMFASDRAGRLTFQPTVAISSSSSGAPPVTPEFDLYIINADGSDLRRITNLSGDEWAPDWRPRR